MKETNDIQIVFRVDAKQYRDLISAMTDRMTKTKEVVSIHQYAKQALLEVIKK